MKTCKANYSKGKHIIILKLYCSWQHVWQYNIHVYCLFCIIMLQHQLEILHQKSRLENVPEKERKSVSEEFLLVEIECAKAEKKRFVLEARLTRQIIAQYKEHHELVMIKLKTRLCVHFHSFCQPFLDIILIPIIIKVIVISVGNDVAFCYPNIMQNNTCSTYIRCSVRSVQSVSKKIYP